MWCEPVFPAGPPAITDEVLQVARPASPSSLKVRPRWLCVPASRRVCPWQEHLLAPDVSGVLEGALSDFWRVRAGRRVQERRTAPQGSRSRAEAEPSATSRC